MSDLRYFRALEKLTNAVEVFMMQSGTDKEKIKEAFGDHLYHLKKEDLPVNCHENFEYICRTLTDESKLSESQKRDKYYGTIFYASSKLASGSIKKIKRCIWEMFCEVSAEIRN